MMAAKTFREWYAFFGGEEMAVSRDEAEVVWKAAIKSLEGVQTQTTNIDYVTALRFGIAAILDSVSDT